MKWRTLGVVAAVLAIIVAFDAWRAADIPDSNTAADHYLAIGSTAIRVEIADTEQSRTRGLSGRSSLDPDKGMLFVFPKANYYTFWMPDMNFPLDIIWMDQNKIVVGVSQDLPPLQDKTKPIYYVPPKPSQYVLEVNAGFAKKFGIKEGNAVTIESR